MNIGGTKRSTIAYVSVSVCESARSSDGNHCPDGPLASHGDSEQFVLYCQSLPYYVADEAARSVEPTHVHSAPRNNTQVLYRQTERHSPAPQRRVPLSA